MVRRYQFVNNLIRQNYASKLRADHINKSLNQLRRPPDNCKPKKIPNLTQKEILTEKVSLLLGQASLRERMIKNQVAQSKKESTLQEETCLLDQTWASNSIDIASFYRQSIEAPPQLIARGNDYDVGRLKNEFENKAHR